MSDMVKVALITLLGTILTAGVTNYDKYSGEIYRLLHYKEIAQKEAEERVRKENIAKGQSILDHYAPKLISERWQGGRNINATVRDVRDAGDKKIYRVSMSWNGNLVYDNYYSLEGDLVVDSRGRAELKPTEMNSTLNEYEERMKWGEIAFQIAAFSMSKD